MSGETKFPSNYRLSKRLGGWGGVVEGGKRDRLVVCFEKVTARTYCDRAISPTNARQCRDPPITRSPSADT